MLARVRHFAARVRAFFRAGRLDTEFQQELESHLAMLSDEYIRRGMTPEQARRAARLRVGSAESLRQQHRDARGWPALDGLLQDVRFSLRMIARERWVSAAIIVTLGLGIGANTVGFTVVNAAFLRSLPFDGADRLYTLTWQTRSGRRADASYPELLDWREGSRSFDGLAAFADAAINISDSAAFPERVRGAWVTANTFSVLRQAPLIGRDFTSADGQRGAEAVVILGHELWQRRYAANPDAVGRSLRLDGQPATIVGVMPPGMKFPDNHDLWAAFAPSETTAQRDARLLTVFGRLTRDVEAGQVRAEMEALAQRLSLAYPDSNAPFAGINVETFAEAFVGGFGRTMFITVMVAVTFVLLVACGNVANLLLARSARRAREIAVRRAVGAPRWRVLRQLLVESVVLALLGGVAGLLVARIGVRAFAGAMDEAGGLPYWITFTMDYVVLGYVGVICVVTAVLFGLAPALQVSNVGCHGVLKEGGRGATGSRRTRRFSSSLIIVELALTIVLLGGATLLMRSLMTLYSVDPGIETSRLMTMRLQLPETRYPTADARRAFFDILESRITAVAGIESAAVTTGVPPFDGGERPIEVERAAHTRERPRFVSTVAITPRFFETVGRPVRRGRNFADADGAPGVETVIINERLAAQCFPGENPIGQRLRFTEREPRPGQPPDGWRTIVGISAGIRHGSPQDAYLNAVVYVPHRQEAPATASLLIRTSLPPASVMPTIRREVQALDADQPVLAIQTVQQMLAADRWPYRVFGSLFVALSGIALMLSAVGLYGTMSYSVTQRTQEIGLRMAVGAQRSDVSWLILRGGLLQLAVGVPVGLAGALALGGVLERMLVGMTPGDPITLVSITTLVVLVALAACVLPAGAATRIDPMTALRAD